MLQIRVDNRRHHISVPLSERPGGFAWLFSFLAYLTELEVAHAGHLILLLDEPGLSMHARAQQDLMRVIDDHLAPRHQVLYTTGSPFMVPVSQLHRVRSIVDRKNRGTKPESTDELPQIISGSISPRGVWPGGCRHGGLAARLGGGLAVIFLVRGRGTWWPRRAVRGRGDRCRAGQAAAAGGPQAASNRFIHSAWRCQPSGRCSVMWPRPCRAMRAATSIRSRRSVAPLALA